MIHTFTMVSASRMMKPPNDWARMYGSTPLCRKKCATLLYAGARVHYEFTESDLRVA